MRNYLIVGLVVLNVILVAVAAISFFHLPAANAQPMGMSGNFLMVAGAILGSKANVVYVVDLENRQLNAFFYDRATQEVSLVGSRDLIRDLASGEKITRPPTGTGIRTRRPPTRF